MHIFLSTSRDQKFLFQIYYLVVRHKQVPVDRGENKRNSRSRFIFQKLKRSKRRSFFSCFWGYSLLTLDEKFSCLVSILILQVHRLYYTQIPTQVPIAFRPMGGIRGNRYRPTAFINRNLSLLLGRKTVIRIIY